MCIRDRWPAYRVSEDRHVLRDEIFPLNVLYNVHLSATEFRKAYNFEETSEDFTYGASRTAQAPGREIYVYVIGEASRAMNWQLYGYDRETNPRLSQVDDLIVFRDMLTQSNTTHKSVPLILSSVSTEEHDQLYRRKGLPALFNEAGFETWFISNQSPQGAMIDKLARDADHLIYIRSPRHDMQLLDEVRRAVPLARINAISQSQLDQYTAQYKAAEATVRSAEQTLSSARMNVGYTELRSPIDGIISNTSAHVGDYVGPGTQFGVLTTISNIDTLTVDVAIPMAQYLRSAGPRTSIFDNAGLLTDIRLMLADGTEYPYEGLYDYTRKDVSSTTGTLVLVVMFPNPDRSLKPGQFARVEASVGPVRPRVVVPQACVSQAQGVNSVWVVRPDSTAMYRRVIPGDTYGSMWCIDEGLIDGELVVTAGQQKLHNGMKVIPEKK